MRLTNRTAVVFALGMAQMLAWGSSYYIPAILAVPMARDLGVDVPTIFAAFSFALLTSAFIGPLAGRAVDLWGGRPVLLCSNLLFAAGLAVLSQAGSTAGLFFAWALLGAAMGSGLYEAAFSTLVRLYGDTSRSAIAGITLLGGFASTVGWPLSTYMELHISWQGACLGWAALHLLIGLPLNALLPSAERRKAAAPERPPETDTVPTATGAGASTATDRAAMSAGKATGKTAVAASAAEEASRSANTQAPPSAAVQSNLKLSIMLAIVFAAAWFNSTAMAAHLPPLLMASGATLTAAVAIGALVGPAQVGARLLEFTLLQRVHPLLSARLAALSHPVGAALLLILGTPAAAAFVVFHGAGNGILTIAIGTLPLVLFGPKGYGTRQGLLMVPARIAQACAPWVFGVTLDAWGLKSLYLSSALALIALAVLMTLRPRKPARA